MFGKKIDDDDGDGGGVAKILLRWTNWKSVEILNVWGFLENLLIATFLHVLEIGITNWLQFVDHFVPLLDFLSLSTIKFLTRQSLIFD